MSEVKELHQFVEGQEHLLLDQLAKLDQEIMRRQEENINRLLEEISSISKQIHELEEKCQQPACEFLQVRLQAPLKTIGIYHHWCHLSRSQINSKYLF